jgi:hypothetical protein
VENRVGADEEAAVRIDAEKEGRVEIVWILIEGMQARVLGAVLHLKPVLIGGSIPCWPAIGEEGVSDDTKPLSQRGFECDAKRGLVGRRGIEDAAARPTACFEDEVEERLPIASADAIGTRLHVRRSLSHRYAGCQGYQRVDGGG